jgi:hypothetical protein
MDHWLKLITDNWAVIAPVLLLTLSEFLALNPKAKSNGLIQLLISLLSRKAK